MNNLPDMTLLDLDRKLSRAARVGRGITLTAAQVDVLVAIGGLKFVSDAAHAELIELAKSRVMGGRSTSEAVLPTRKRHSPSSDVDDAISPEMNDRLHRAAEDRALQAASEIIASNKRRRRRNPASSASSGLRTKPK